MARSALFSETPRADLAAPDEQIAVCDDASSPKTTRADWRMRAGVLTVLGVAFALRCIGVTWHLPYVYHPDEPTNLAVVRGMLVRHSLNPRFFDYPSLFFYVYGAAIGAWYEFGHAVGWFHSAATMPRPELQVLGDGVMRDGSPLIVARLVSVFGSVATVATGMVMCGLITRRRAAILLAGALIACNPTLVRNARWFTPDTLAALTATLAVLAALVVARRPRLRHYLIAGAAIGLATSAKYNVAIVGIALVVAHFVARHEAHDEPVPLRYLGYAAGVAVLAFFVTTPYAIFDFHRFWNDFTFDLHHYSTGHVGAEGNSPGTNLNWLWGAIGPAVLLVVGMWLLKPLVRRLCLVPLSFAVAYFVAISAAVVRFERNVVPLLPAVLVVVAVIAVEVADRARAHLANRRAWLALASGALVIVVGWPLLFAVRDVQAALTDYRAGAHNWITANVPAGGKVDVDAYSPFVDRHRYRVTARQFVVQKFDQIRADDADAAVVTALGSGRFLSGADRDPASVAAFNAELASACNVAEFGSGSHRIWVLRFHC